MIVVISLLALVGVVYGMWVKLNLFRVYEFVKLLQVPVLKGDLNRILKVCITYEKHALSRAAHAVMLKCKRPFEIEMVVQSRWLEMTHTVRRTQGTSWAGRLVLVVTTLAFVPFVQPGKQGDLSVFSAVMLVCLAISFEWLQHTRIRNLQDQIQAFLEFRMLVYGNLSKLDNDGSAWKSFVPKSFVLREVTRAEYEAEVVKNTKFVEHVLAEKAVGREVDVPKAYDEFKVEDGL